MSPRPVATRVKSQVAAARALGTKLDLSPPRDASRNGTRRFPTGACSGATGIGKRTHSVENGDITAPFILSRLRLPTQAAARSQPITSPGGRLAARQLGSCELLQVRPRLAPFACRPGCSCFWRPRHIYRCLHSGATGHVMSRSSRERAGPPPRRQPGVC